MKAWHFVGDTLRDGRPVPPDGEWLVHDGKCVICRSGLHASERIIDALQYAPGSTVCRVELEGIGGVHPDRVVASRRKILWRVDAGELLQRFARQQALAVIDLWDAPDIVREYLETGDESKRADARDTAQETVEYAAREAREYATWDVMECATWDVVEYAARAARNAAEYAARAAEQVVWYSAWYSAQAATRAAARDAAWDAACGAWDAARDAADTILETMVRHAYEKEKMK